MNKQHSQVEIKKDGTRAIFYQINRYGQITKSVEYSGNSITAENWAKVISGILTFGLFKYVVARKEAHRRGFDGTPVYVAIRSGNIVFNSMLEDVSEHSDFKVSNDSQRRKFHSVLLSLFAAKFFSNARCEEYDVEKLQNELGAKIKEAKELSEERTMQRRADFLSAIENGVKLMPKQLAAYVPAQSENENDELANIDLSENVNATENEFSTNGKKLETV